MVGAMVVAGSVQTPSTKEENSSLQTSVMIITLYILCIALYSFQ